MHLPFCKSRKTIEQVIVHPVANYGRLCRAEPWGADGFTHCPFLTQGRCHMWGFNIQQRPDKVAACPVFEVLVPLADA